MDVETVLAALVAKGGAAAIVALLLAAVWAFVNEHIVSGKTYRASLQNGNDWKEIALQGSGNMEKAVSLAERRRLDAASD